MRPDIQGKLTLKKEGGRIGPIFSDYRPQVMKIDSDQLHSCIVFFTEEQLDLGEPCTSNLLFLFSGHEKFHIELSVGETLNINECRKTIGKYTIEKIFNKKLDCK